MYREADKVWQEHLERQLNKDTSIGDSVQGNSAQAVPKTESYVASEGLAVSAVNPPSGEIEKLIYEVAKEENFEDAELLVRIARAESSLQTCVKNPHSSAIGLYQILDLHGLTKEERCNPEIATRWAINKIKSGGISAWNSSRKKWEI